jgi:hypothetical protein
MNIPCESLIDARDDELTVASESAVTADHDGGAAGQTHAKFPNHSKTASDAPVQGISPLYASSIGERRVGKSRKRDSFYSKRKEKKRKEKKRKEKKSKEKKSE